MSIRTIELITGTRKTWGGVVLTDNFTVKCGDTIIATGHLPNQLHGDIEDNLNQVYMMGYKDGCVSGRTEELTRSNKLLQAINALFGGDVNISREEAIQMLGVLKQEMKQTGM